jgi:hypothetical protein
MLLLSQHSRAYVYPLTEAVVVMCLMINMQHLLMRLLITEWRQIAWWRQDETAHHASAAAV